MGNDYQLRILDGEAERIVTNIEPVVASDAKQSLTF